VAGKGRSFGFLVINVCNQGEHYEMPCIVVVLKILLFDEISCDCV
jgi:hypothetical protein